MDPDVCYRRYREAMKEGDWLEAYHARRDLLAWLYHGGFEPKWSKAVRAKFMSLRTGDAIARKAGRKVGVSRPWVPKASR